MKRREFLKGLVLAPVIVGWAAMLRPDKPVPETINMDKLLHAREVLEIADTQKFPIGTRVFVAKDLGPAMSHFPSGCEAIVDGTYAQQYGGRDTKSYDLQLLDENGSPCNRVAWYHEDQLTWIGQTYF
jgi:hypothetical protein